MVVQAERFNDLNGANSFDQRRVLTERDCDYIRAIGQGKTFPEVAEELNVSDGMVNIAMRRLRKAVGVYTNTQLVVYAVASGCIGIEKIMPPITIHEPEDSRRLNPLLVSRVPLFAMGATRASRSETKLEVSTIATDALKARRALGFKSDAQTVLWAIERGFYTYRDILCDPSAIPERVPAVWGDLSDRDKQLIKLTCMGFQQKQIATKIGGTKLSVNQYMVELRRRCMASNNLQMALRFLETGDLDLLEITEGLDLEGYTLLEKSQYQTLNAVIANRDETFYLHPLARRRNISTSTVTGRMVGIYEKTHALNVIHAALGYLQALREDLVDKRKARIPGLARLIA